MILASQRTPIQAICCKHCHSFSQYYSESTCPNQRGCFSFQQRAPIPLPVFLGCVRPTFRRHFCYHLPQPHLVKKTRLDGFKLREEILFPLRERLTSGFKGGFHLVIRSQSNATLQGFLEIHQIFSDER